MVIFSTNGCFFYASDTILFLQVYFMAFQALDTSIYAVGICYFHLLAHCLEMDQPSHITYLKGLKQNAKQSLLYRWYLEKEP